MKISIYQSSNKTVYAASELQHFLEEFTNVEIAEQELCADKSIILTVDTSMEPHQYSIHGNGTRLEISGGNESSVLCGVCEALSEAGIFFEATGYSVPHTFDLDVLFHMNRDVCPKFRQRGIRQHINFPMDISSYPLPMAKEYIRSLARMRYNAIAFHSYPSQWHEAHIKDVGKEGCGCFFYGQKHPIPNRDSLTASRIENRTTYCIPEAEVIYEDDTARSSYAKYWLNQVMQTAKEAGMAVSLSVELRYDDEDAIVKLLHHVCETYPLIDTLELMTEECGRYRPLPGLTRENIVEFTADAFGKDILDENGNLPGLNGYSDEQYGETVVDMKRILGALERREEWLSGLANKPKLRVGLYLTDIFALKILYPILCKKVPTDVSLSVLPAHGSLAVSNNLEKMNLSKEDWERTMVYTWAEFDGNMYLQQQAAEGLGKLCELPETDRAYGMCINHWRTSENNMAISYVAEASITVKAAEDFYRWYAEVKGIGDKETFVQVSRKLSVLDTYNRDNLMNIGFCFVGCWLDQGRRQGRNGVMVLYPTGVVRSIWNTAKKNIMR